MIRLIIALSLIIAVPASAAIIQVDPGSGGDYPTIQAALNVAQSGDVVELAPGVYWGDGNTNLEFYANVTVRGTGDPAQTIIRCYGSESSPRGAFQLWEETGGTVENLTVEQGWGSNGGAIGTGWGSYTFRDCRFLDNHATRGGVWYGEQQGDVTFEDCLFARNTADGNGGCLAATDETELTVRGCTFINNAATAGAGVHLETDAMAAIETTIMAWNRGGGAAGDDYSPWFTIECSDFYGNVGGNFPAGTAGGDGNFSADPRLVDPWGDTPDVDLASDSPCREDLACTTMGSGAELGTLGCTYRLDAQGTGMAASIQDAIVLVQHANDQIVLDDGIYSGPGNEDIESNLKSFTLRSRSDDPAACQLIPEGEGQLGRRHMHLTGNEAQVQLRGLGFHGGSTPEGDGFGGSLKVRRILDDTPFGTLTLSSCVFRDNRATLRSGAIDMVSADLVMDGTEFYLNSSAGSAGAMTNLGGKIEANDCRFEDNRTDDQDSAAWSISRPDAESLLMEVAVGNHQGTGIAITELDQDIRFESCTFWDNVSPHSGAGLEISGNTTADPSLVNCEFHGNLSTARGGGIYANTKLAAINCRFLYNEGLDGGGLYVLNDVLLTDCTFTGNMAYTDHWGDGGAVWALRGMVSGCEVTENQAWDAGGFYIRDLITPMTDCLFQGNAAFHWGGGLYTGGVVDGCTFIGNAADDGGGAFMNYGEVHGSVFWRNEAAESASALAVRPEMHLETCTIVENVVLQSSWRSQIGVMVYGSGSEVTPPSLHNSIVAYGSGQYAMDFSSQSQGLGSIVPGIGDGTVSCCLFWQNDMGITDIPQLVIEPSCIQNVAPGFCDLEAGDLTLHYASAARPDNNSCGVLIGALGQGCGEAVGVDDDSIPTATTLLGNHPNPFNPTTSVAFAMGEGGHAILEIINLKGERLAVLVDQRLDAGQHAVTWNGRDQAGRDQPSGVYLARLITAGTMEVQKMALVR